MAKKRALFGFLIIACGLLTACANSATTTVTLTSAAGLTATPEAQDIVDLVDIGTITFKITSGAINYLELELNNTTNQLLLINIPAGTFFINDDPNSQNMVVRHAANTSVPGNGKRSIRLDAACANLHLIEPAQGNTFTIVKYPRPPQLTMIIDKINTTRFDYPVEQASIWIVTDDATFDELGMLVAGSRFGNSIINEDDATSAMMLVDESGLSIRDYAIWADRWQLLDKVTDPVVSTWMNSQLATQVVIDATQSVAHATQTAQMAKEIAIEETRAAQEITRMALQATQTFQALPTPVGVEISQYASSAQASSQWSSEYSARQAVGAPNTLICADRSTAWASQSATGKDWLMLFYDQAVIPSKIVISESFNPGAVSKVEVIDESGNAITVYEATPVVNNQCPFNLVIDIKSVSLPVRTVRLTIDQSRHNGWNEIDAVQLTGYKR